MASVKSVEQRFPSEVSVLSSFNSDLILNYCLRVI